MLGKTMTGVLLEAFPTRRFVGPSPLELVADQGPWKTAPFFLLLPRGVFWQRLLNTLFLVTDCALAQGPCCAGT